MDNNFEKDLTTFVNYHGIDAKLNLPDYVVAKHIVRFIHLLRDYDNDLSNHYDGANNQDIFESMDGDHSSALSSAGWGTDEDYGDGERL